MARSYYFILKIHFLTMLVKSDFSLFNNEFCDITGLETKKMSE